MLILVTGSIQPCKFLPLMDNQFFEKPVLNSPYAFPSRHWELDAHGQPTQQIMETRRSAQFITPIPKPRKLKGHARQESLVLDEPSASTLRSWTPLRPRCLAATGPRW